MEFSKKLATAQHLAETRGISGVAEAAAVVLLTPWRTMRRWWYRDYEWLGSLVQARGNLVRLDDCRFDVSHPQITNALRARLLRGRYERSELEILRTWLDPDAPVIELGGGIGIVSTLVNRRLHHPERHVVVEANPSLIPVIERQKMLNGAAFTVEHAAIGYSPEGTVTLHVDQEFISARLGATGGTAISVHATTLGAVLERHPWTGATLVCDIEGVETELIAREGDLIARHFSTLIVETHPEFRTPEQREAMLRQLSALGFESVATVRKVHAFRHVIRSAAPRSDPSAPRAAPAGTS